MTSETTVLAAAKINLTLHVTGQRDDGYHLLDSLVVFADVCDRLTLTPGPALAMTVTGLFADGVPADARNLAWSAAERAGWTGHITLEKNIPHGAGIGGGSADAAAVLRALGAAEHALNLGADVPVCLASRAQRMRGIGEVLDDAPPMPDLWAVLVNPGVHVATPDVFRALECRKNAPMPDVPGFSKAVALAEWLTAQRNDLEAAARLVAPEIGGCLRALSACEGVLLSRMSGSGATCFGLFADQGLAEKAARALSAVQPGCWVTATSLR